MNRLSEEILMVNKHMKRCSFSLLIRELKNETIVRFFAHFVGKKL